MKGAGEGNDAAYRHNFLVIAGGPRPPLGEVVERVYGPGTEVDVDGDGGSDSAEWTWLFVQTRPRRTRLAIEINPEKVHPGLLWVSSDHRALASRAARFLADRTGGDHVDESVAFRLRLAGPGVTHDVAMTDRILRSMKAAAIVLLMGIALQLFASATQGLSGLPPIMRFLPLIGGGAFSTLYFVLAMFVPGYRAHSGRDRLVPPKDRR